MPKSRKRTVRPAALKGIPTALLAKAPASLTPTEKAQWVKCNQDGMAGRPFRRPNQASIDAAPPLARSKMIERSPSWHMRAYMLGKAGR